MRTLWYTLVGWWFSVRPSDVTVGATMMMEGYTDLEINAVERDIRRMHMEDIKHLLLTAPDGQLDGSMKPLIENWSIPATAVQILEVLDPCVRCSLASGFTVSVLQLLYDTALKNEGKTHEDIVKLATWR